MQLKRVPFHVFDNRSTVLPFSGWVFFLIRIQIRRQKFSNRGNIFESILYVIQMNLFTKQKQTHKHRKQLIVAKGERGKGRDTLGL